MKYLLAGIIYLATFYSIFLTGKCVAYKVSITHTEHLQSIEFFKDGIKLPDFLMNFDFDDFLNDNGGGGDKVLRADTHKAFFDTIVIEKKPLKDRDAENHSGAIEVYDDVTDKTWMGVFGTLGEVRETLTMSADFVTEPPLDSVQIIDTMQ